MSHHNVRPHAWLAIFGQHSGKPIDDNKQMMRVVTLVAILGAALSLNASAQSNPQADSAPLATVNGTVITNADVDKSIAADLAKLEAQIYDLRKDSLDALVADQLIAQEAAKRRVTVAALIDAEITSKQRPVTDEEIAQFYRANQARLQQDLGAWREQIRSFLTAQKSDERRKVFVDELLAKNDVAILLKAPTVIRVDIPIGTAYTRGPADAPVTLVEYGDFHCPFCKSVQATITQLFTKYNGRIRMIYKDLPLDNLHPQARAAAEAARCAGEQGKFWEFHDQIYAGEPDASAPTMRRYAQQLGLDLTKFEACRSSRKYQAQVQADAVEGAKFGVTGTPGFFVNGRPLFGAQPLDAFSRIVDEELALHRAPGGAPQ